MPLSPLLDIAVIGSGVAGLSAAWLLAKTHRVTLYEAANRLGGHTNTVEAEGADGRPIAVDTGFIVYNEKTYPNLVALFDHLEVETRGSDMSFAVSLDKGGLEYGSTHLNALFAQRRNFIRPRFWSMIRDLQRFYKTAPKEIAALTAPMSLGEFLDSRGYGQAFQRDHILPQAAAIWSTAAGKVRDYPALAFIRFFENHGLLELDIAARPQWRTVVGGSKSYIPHLIAGCAVRLGAPIRKVVRGVDGVALTVADGQVVRHDQVVIAAHADQALRMLGDPTPEEAKILGAFRYTLNDAVLHTDVRLMPRRKAAWSAWNYVGDRKAGEVTYWMNKLQGLESREPLLVSLNPGARVRAEKIIRTETYTHPLYDQGAIDAQARLWTLQGVRRTWYCGAYFGAGFHEDGLQSGLAVAEHLGGAHRPWTTPALSSRIHAPLFGAPEAQPAAA